MNMRFKTALYLHQLWQAAELCSALPEHIKPTTLEEGYQAQEALIELTQSSCSGWKLGVASDSQLAKAELSRPLIGRILTNRCFKKNQTIPMPPAGNLTIEGEIGLILHHDILPGRPEPVSWLDVSHIILSFEVVRSRFINRRAVGWPSFIADNVGFEALITSDAIAQKPSDALIDRLLYESYITLDDQIVSRPLTGKDGINPLTSLAHLVDHSTQYGIALKAGEIISTGAFYQPFDLTDRNHRIKAINPWGEFGFAI